MPLSSMPICTISCGNWVCRLDGPHAIDVRTWSMPIAGRNLLEGKAAHHPFPLSNKGQPNRSASLALLDDQSSPPAAASAVAAAGHSRSRFRRSNRGGSIREASYAGACGGAPTLLFELRFASCRVLSSARSLRPASPVDRAVTRPFRSLSVPSFPNRSTSPLRGRNGCMRSSSTAIVWPRASTMAAPSCLHGPGSIGLTNTRASSPRFRSSK